MLKWFPENRQAVMERQFYLFFFSPSSFCQKPQQHAGSQAPLLPPSCTSLVLPTGFPLKNQTSVTSWCQCMEASPRPSLQTSPAHLFDDLLTFSHLPSFLFLTQQRFHFQTPALTTQLPWASSATRIRQNRLSPSLPSAVTGHQDKK